MDNPDHEFLTGVYKKFYPVMKWTALKIVKSEQAAEDVAMDTIIRLLPRVPQLRELEEPVLAAYILTAVRNTARNHYKQAKRRVALDHMELADTKEPDEIAQLENADEIRGALAGLDDRDWDLLFLRYIMDFTPKEVAKEMNIPEKQVYVYLARAKKRAEKLLRKGGI